MMRPRLIDYGVAGRAKPGEMVSGDCAALREQPDCAIILVADGLGHGPEAARAAALAVTLLDEGAWQPITRLMERCHAALGPTRGAALALAVFDAITDTLTWLAVGNVEGRLIWPAADGGRSERSLLMHSGIVGHHLPNSLHVTRIPLRPGHVVAIATDGIRGEFEPEVRLDLSPQQAAQRVLARCAKATDDAHVVIGRWIGRNGAR